MRNCCRWPSCCAAARRERERSLKSVASAELQLPEATAAAIYELDEHWDGHGNPCGLKGEEISLLGRICCLAQTVEVFYSTYGLDVALDVAEQRRGQWFDPELVSA